MDTTQKNVKVWDPVVRIGHWILVIAFFTAYFTEDDLLTQHVWAGYVVTAIVLFRLIWGFIGSKHAKLSDFIYSPRAVFAYLKGLARRKPQHYLGHNPAGGAMVIALLISLSGTTFTGLKLYAVEKNAGPFACQATVRESTPASGFIATAQADEEEDMDGSENTMVNEEDEDYWEGLHEFFVNFTLLLVVLHIGGVILSSLIDKENLVKAMITGTKKIPQDNV